MFCPNCGKELNEGETCNCTPAQDNAPGQVPPEQPVQQQTPPEQPVQEPVPQQTPPEPPVQQSQANGFAIAGFVLALLALFLFWVPTVGTVLAVLAIVFSITGIAMASKKGGSGRGFAIAGFIIGLVPLVLIIAIGMFIRTAALSCLGCMM